MVTARNGRLMPPKLPPSLDDPRFMAAVDLLGRTGSKTFEMRFSEPEEMSNRVGKGPVVWMAIGEWVRDGKVVYEVGAHTNPLVALFRLLDTVVDGGMCTYCGKPTGFSEDADVMPLDEMFCWYQWDPERKKFRRGCEGDDK